MGLVPDLFGEEVLSRLKGHMALGHVRYSTTGSSLLMNASPEDPPPGKDARHRPQRKSRECPSDPRTNGRRGLHLSATTDSEVVST